MNRRSPWRVYIWTVMGAIPVMADVIWTAHCRMNLTPTESVIHLFKAAGWQKRSTRGSSIAVRHPAVHVLEQFGGLHIVPPETDGAFTSDILFGQLAELGNLLDRPLDEIVPKSGWSKLLGTPLVCIAEYHYAHGVILIAGDGRVFIRSQMHDAMGFQADDFPTAIEQILLGAGGSKPMIRPDQDAVTWCGINYTHGDAELYNYA